MGSGAAQGQLSRLGLGVRHPQGVARAAIKTPRKSLNLRGDASNKFRVFDQ